VRYHLLIASYEAIYVRGPSASSTGRYYKLSDSISGLTVWCHLPLQRFTPSLLRTTMSLIHVVCCLTQWVWPMSTVACYNLGPTVINMSVFDSTE
jgi:hypothetical protein